KYPHYRMNFEGAFRYKLMKEYYPEMYEKVKKYVAEGRWNVSGSQWDASDANVPSSEGYMRSILYGNGYFESEFGKKSTDIFLTDCFGFRWSLPSIAAHMGLNGFSTQKLVWGVGSPVYHEDGSVTKPMPDKEAPRMDLGKWVGPDGHYVIASMLGGNYTFHFEWDKEKRPIHDRREFADQIAHNEKWAGVPARMMYYGVGDFGGAPSEESVRYLNEAVEQNGPDQDFEVISASTDQIMNELTPEQIEKLPAYEGGLLIPHGYGALTSHTINKRWNRKSELLADSAERLAAIAKWKGIPYPKERLGEAWKTFLWHQFHDDLPGTSIMDAYRFTHNDFVVAQNLLASELTASAESVARTLKTNVAGTPVLVYNPVSSSRQDLVTAEIDVKTPYVRVFAPCGCEMPAQVERREGKTYVKFAAKMKPVSVAVFDIRESEEPSPLESKLSVTENTLTNENYRVTLNEKGDIASVYDRINEKELLSAPSVLEVREDNNTVWPSWEIAYKDIEKTPVPVTDCVSVEIYENGPAAVSLKVVKTYEHSTFTQIIRLCTGGKWVEVENNVDWLCRRSMLMAEFPLSVSNPVAEFDLGLGADRGENTNSFPYFQHCVHQWADLTDSDGTFGVSILNDCKYGMEKPNDNTLRLSLIHTPLGSFMPISAQDWQDMGKNLFRYGITSHKGDRDAVGSLAAEFNQPMFTFVADKHDGDTGRIVFATVNHDAVVIRAIKEEEKGSRLIVRVQETSGKPQENVTLNFPSKILSAVETNGYEDEIAPASFDGQTLTFSIGKYEPKTFALTLESDEMTDSSAGIPLELAYTHRITTSDHDLTVGEIADGVSIPAELFESKISCGGLNYTLGDANGMNAIRADGQTIRLPEGVTKLAVLATSAADDQSVLFTAGTKEIPVTVRNFQRPVGAWDLIGKGDSCMTLTDDLAAVYTHTHDHNGNRLYQFAYVYRYDLDVTGADRVTLPINENVLILAATAFNGGSVRAASPIYDCFPEKKEALHHLTVEGVEGMDGDYPTGRRILLTADELGRSGLFDHWEGNAKVIFADKNHVIIEMGDTDVTLRAVYSSIGENMVLGKPCKASHFVDESEAPDMAVNGNDLDKWCGEWNEKDMCWLEVDMGDPTFIDKWIVRHCGAYEDKRWNTFDFGLQYRTYEDEDWKMADAVIANHDNLTFRAFKPVMARFVRLYITLPAHPGKDKQSRFARIYQFQVYKAKSEE
ncbi:MAG: glycoside hydrolase family 38 C-terminal domain-containing protein, partial [Eubacteriales bacterium]